ncbi:AAA family ATPase [Bacillus thuringiensis]|uniref:nucleotide-binding protein n=1 Tax=Bacillus TaxID=1386 RepID=UPI00027BFF7B|nr:MULTISPECIES: AAA family ATPase [Bacillus]EJV74911.1 hypothetical protein IGE_05449 [Bacillus cereus HuB1-1]MED3622258.1 AAA family ATPase [Bacillus thuringiensis]PEW81022.1 hypothetical protein CN447_29020 [Bacillus thuringiensis]PGS64244.1 hypothetical protein COD07_28030 [Bacillus thuringiensis]
MKREPIRIMIQGTRAGIGKSLITVGLARLLNRAGYRTQVFKAQAMDNKKYQLSSGGFIPPSMACAAQGTGHTPDQRHTPIYLKPLTNVGPAVDNFSLDQQYEVYVMGKYIGVQGINEYLSNSSEYYDSVRESLQSLISESDAIIIEGAGCPTELTELGDGLANAVVAEEANSDVWLVSDLLLGGAFASAVGTLSLMSENEKKRVKSVILNKALEHGDVKFLQGSIGKLKKITNINDIAVVPLMPDPSKVFNVLKFNETTPVNTWLWDENYDYWTEHLKHYLPPTFLNKLDMI